MLLKKERLIPTQDEYGIRYYNIWLPESRNIVYLLLKKNIDIFVKGVRLPSSAPYAGGIKISYESFWMLLQTLPRQLLLDQKMRPGDAWKEKFVRTIESEGLTEKHR